MLEWINRIAFDSSSPLIMQGNEHQFGFQVHEPEVMAHSHWHGHIEINYLFGCAADYLINGRRISVPEGKMIIFWASIPHQMTASSGDGHMVNIYIPLQAFQAWKFPPEFVGLLLRGEVLVSEKLHRSDYELTRQWEQDLQRKQAALTAQVISEIRGRIRRMAVENYSRYGLGTDTARELKNPVSGLGHIDAMLRYIADHYDQKITIEQVAAATGLHPNYAMKLFNRVMKISIKQYINRLRLQHAQALLVDTDQGVLNIAIEAGFGSISRFYDIFQRELKMTPQAFRSQTQKMLAGQAASH
ncbi:helix-turn-helix domain-containing protein [Shewanella cyperi]|uniref:helix-turn-helix domain-containing protein n=1 Tax=Shewanella cyperi TaxID=2814292 RepID=UPI001A94D98C|nr:helix-turn-helix domain-containing protein [Shewanella cyperi]QSX41409.1 helix-turn-helix domain-containing protein [Shewanella cyperi]